MADRALAQIRGTALGGEHRDGGLQAVLGGGDRVAHSLQRIGARVTIGFQRLHRRPKRVQHGLFTAPGLATLLDALIRRSQRRDQVGELRRVPTGQHAAGSQEGGAIQRPGRAADGPDQRHADHLQRRSEIAVADLGELDGHRREAPVQIGAMVGIPDRGVELRQVGALLMDPSGDRLEVGHQVRRPDPRQGFAHS